jgi:hypothetical protein
MLLGRAYQHIRWGGPYRDIFYHPDGFGGWYANLIGRPLGDIYNDHFYEFLLDYFANGIGVIFILSAFIILFYERLARLKWIVFLSVGFLGLTFFGLLYGKNLAQYGMFFEHSSQLVFPLLFIWTFNKRLTRVVIWGTISIAMTFLCHGLYAYGYYPQPGHFADMMILGFGFTEDLSRSLLIQIGVLDFIYAGLAMLFLIPYMFGNTSNWWVASAKINMWYAVIWGLLTAVARLYTSYSGDLFWHWADQYWLEFFVRIPHFIVPYVLINFLPQKRLLVS